MVVDYERRGGSQPEPADNDFRVGYWCGVGTVLFVLACWCAVRLAVGHWCVAS